MTRRALQNRTTTRHKRLALVGLLTLAATVWAALQPDEHAPTPIGRTEDAVPARAPDTRRREKQAAPAPVARPLSWPDSSHLETRIPWRAALPQGVAAWSGAPPPATRPAAPAGPVAPAAPVAPPSPAIAVATSPPVPAFPYKLIGRLDDGVPQALLSGPTRSFGVKAGDAIDAQWRVDSVEAQSVTVTWLRTGARKTLSFASS